MEGLKGATVLVTGAGGFLGKHVMRALQEAGALPIAVSRQLGLDLTLVDRALSMLLVTRAPLVIHLAAPSIETTPATQIRDTLQMGMNVMTACSSAGAKLVFVSRSSTPSERAVQQALLENARAHQKACGLTFAQVLPGDLYGPLDRMEGTSLPVVPYLLTEIQQRADQRQKLVTLKGNPKTKFEPLHVSDAAAAIVRATDLPGCAEPLYLEGTQSIPIEEMAETVAGVCKFKGEIEWESEEARWTPNTGQEGALAREVLDWKPAVTFQAGIEETHLWRFGAPKAEPAPKGKK